MTSQCYPVITIVSISYFFFFRVKQTTFNLKRMGCKANAFTERATLTDLVKNKDALNEQHRQDVLRQLQSDPRLISELILLVQMRL